MANDNVVANSGSGGATFRTLSDGTNEWVAEVAAYVTGGSANSWTLAPVDLTHGLPVQPMTGATWAATQSGTWNITNISGTVSLPTGASTAAKQPALGTAGTASSDVITIQGIASMTAVKVDGSGVTQPVSGTVTANAGTGTMAVSAASLPLPSGAATSAKQPALGTAGTASTDVISVQGIASMTALKVDGSGVTQPVSWTSQTVSITANSSVNVAQMNGVATTMGNGVSGTGVQRVTIASDSTGQVALASGSNTIGALTANQSVNVAQMNGVATTMGNGTSGTGVQRVTIASDSTGQVALAAGTNTVGAVNLKPVTSGGLSFKKVLSASGTNLTSVKASAGQIYGIYLACTNASARYLHLYNVASGSVTVGTTAPDITFAIPGNASGAGFVLTTEQGIAFGTAITYALTTGSADTDTGAVASGEITGAILYA